jgi:hypothetical protein
MGVTIEGLIKALLDTRLPGDAEVQVEHVFSWENPKFELYATVDVVDGAARIKIDSADRKE